MYDRGIIRERLAAVSKQLNFTLTRHALVDVQHANERLNRIYDPEKSQPIRPLHPHEKQWIQNERAYCMCDFLYWARRYGYILDSQDRLVRFRPNVAQRIILDVWAELEHVRRGIEIQEGKARQLGVSTLTELAVAHRVQFYPNVNAVVASSDPSKSAKLAQMMERAWDNQPWWLMPERTTNRTGELIEFGYQNSGISIQHGAQFTGIARGDAPTVCHLSEVSEFINPEELVDASLFPAMHPSLWLFLMLESTAKKLHDWWHDSWNYNKANWASGRSRLRTVFLPWFVGTDIWPNASWVRDHPVPSDWKIPELIVKHAERAQAYVQQSDLLRKHLGENWSMPIEQMWFYEVTREEYKAKHELAKFYCVSGNTLISSEQGILPICEAQSVKRVETGEVGSWFVRGKRSVVTVRTKNGREITCTPDHRFYTTNQEWVSAEQLKTGDLIRLCVPSFRTDSFVKTWNWFPGCQMSTTIDDNWSRFIGYFLGDGSWFGDTVEIACARRDPDTVEDVCNLCRKLTGANPTLKTKKGCVQVRSFSTKWWQVLWALGLLDRRVLKKQNRHSGYRKRCRVPECIFKSPRSIIAQFLRGLFEADGCSSRTAVQIGFFAKSPEFTREVQLLLLGFGINSNIRPVKKVTKDGREYFGNTMWLNAEAAEVFFREIGFVSERKNSGKRHVHPKMGRHRIPNRLEDTIESVTPAGEEDVYDISVPSVCSFGANGILAHNSEFPADDIEMFQSPNLGVFEPDLIAEYNESTKPPKAVFGFTGACVPLRIQPDRREIDTNQRPIHLSRRLPQGGTFDCTLVPLHFQGYAETDFTNKLFVWEFAEKGCDYGIGVDTSDGVGQDRSVIESVRKGDSQRNDVQCAEFASAYINAFDLSSLVYAVGCLYSPDPECQPKMVIECNRNGQATQLEVRKMGWMNFHQWMPRYDKKRLSQARANYLGWETNARTRPLMMDNLVRMLRDGWIDVLSPWLVDEMRDLERDEAKQRLAACYGGFDDRIMSLAAVLWSLHALELQGTQRGMLFERMQRQSESNIAVYPLYNPQTAYSRPISLEGDEYGR